MIPSRDGCLKALPAVLLAAACGCSVNNGLPGDLESLLADSGIAIHILESDAPFDSRSGFVRIARDEALEAMIVEAFDMTPIDHHDPLSADLAERTEATPVAVWGVTGSPGLLLEDGGRFLYLYLMVTDDGRTFIFAEYAYG
jgi:hypothetical protein